MRFIVWSLLLLYFEFVGAIRIPLQTRRSRSSSVLPRSGNGAVSIHDVGRVLVTSPSPNTTLSLDDVHDLIYIANVTVGGNEYPVQLDTGSSDLWIHGQYSPLPNSVQSTIAYNLTYGLGWAFGRIAYAPTQFAGVSIKNQSYLDVSSANNPALGYGATGILGLGFTSLSTIDSLVNQTGSSAGRSLLFNAFSQNPSEPNFISFALPRILEPVDQGVGAVTIGEYVAEYSSVANTPHIPTWPVNSPRRWNVLLDALLVGNGTFPVTSTVVGAPLNKAVVLLDTGTSYTYAPVDVCQAIYGSVPGAYYNPGMGTWIVPCNVEIDMALQINNRAYPIHPLDVSPYDYPDTKTCVGSFIPQVVSVGVGQFDWLIGDNVLRSIYSVYDFGTFDSSGNMGNPFLQLLPIVDPNEASAEFAAIRGSTPRTNITYNVSPVAGGGTVSIADISTTLSKLNTYIPVMLGVMALNALVIVLLLVLGIIYLCRRQRGAVARKTQIRTSTVPLSPTTFRTSQYALVNQSHTYEPVTSAISEDTFLPPSPAFRKANASGKRPHSSYQPSTIAAKEDSLIPPSLSFVKDQEPDFLTSGNTGKRPYSSYQPSSVAAQEDSFVPPSIKEQKSGFPRSDARLRVDVPSMSDRLKSVA